MVLAAFTLVFILSVESLKASSRIYYRRQSRKHGYADLPTDSYGRPINERGEKLSRNEARALTAHIRELARIRTAEREWRLQGEKLPNYEEARSSAVRDVLRRPNTAHSSGSRSVNRSLAGERATSWAGTPSAATAVRPSTSQGLCSTSATTGTSAGRGSGDNGFALRRNGQQLSIIHSRGSHGEVTVVAVGPSGLTGSTSSPLDETIIDDILQHDGMDWQRATWEGSPIYSETERPPTLPASMAAGGNTQRSIPDTLDPPPSRLLASN